MSSASPGVLPPDFGRLEIPPPRARVFIFERGAIDDTTKLREELAAKLSVPFVLIEVNQGFRFEELD